MATTSYGTPYVQSSDLVSGWPNASLNVANRIDEVSYAGNGINAQTGTTYTLVVGDAGKTVTLSNAAAVAVTLPQDSVANLPTGAVVNFYNLGAGTVTISAGAGATFQGGPLTAAQYGCAAVIKLSANTYGPFQAVPTAPGLVLVTPSSIANSGGSASASGGAVTFSGVTSVSLNGAFTSTYAAYRIVISFSGSTSLGLNARLRASGSDATGSDYDRQSFSAYGTSSAANQTNGSNSWSFGQGGTTRTSLSVIDIYNPQVAANTAYLGMCILPGSNSQIDVNGGFHILNTSYDGFSLIPATGNITGTVRVYGYKNS